LDGKDRQSGAREGAGPGDRSTIDEDPGTAARIESTDREDARKTTRLLVLGDPSQRRA
jgi:hypothetical protein